VQIASRQEQIGSGIRDLLAAVLRARGPEEIEPAPTAAGLLTEEITYLRLLQNKCNRLPLALASDTRATGARDGAQVELARVYVDLQTTSDSPWDLVFDRLGVPHAERDKATRAWRKLDQAAGKRGEREAFAEEMTLAHLGGRLDFDKHPLKAWAKDEESLRAALQPMTALEALARHKRLVLLGKPGSGKTTLVNHLAFTLAGALLSPGMDWLTVLQEAFAAPLFPIRVVLRSWSAKLQADSRAGVELAYAALTTAIGLSDRKRLLARLESPSTLILFDGLDEVPAGDGDAVDRRRLVVASVQAFCVAHPHCHVLVTSRVKPYREQQSIYQMPDLPVFELADLDTARIQRFTYRWYEELIRIERLSAVQAGEARDQLLQAINRRRELATMAGTPLLLTMLARVNARAGLPDSRAELYDECVEQLLWEWEKGKAAQESEGPATPVRGLYDLLQDGDVKLNRADLEQVLWEITYRAHGQSGRETVDLPADLLEKQLALKHPHRHSGKAWASQVVDLMRERGGLLVESEPGHFTFPHRTFQEYLAARGLLAQADPGERAAALAGDDTWREVILLACGYLTFKGQRNILRGILASLAAGAFETPEEWRRLLVVAQAWLESGPHRDRDAIGADLRKKLPPVLTALMQSPAAPASQRLEAGLLASDLGDRPDDLDAFVPIQAQARLGYDFRIGKYPVTNVGYHRFVEAGGYDRSRPWWTPQAIKDIEYFQKDYDPKEPWPDGPRFRNDSRFNHATQPVVGISWYEANAYCTWLTGELRRIGQLDQAEAVRLPTEAEWEWAAAGQSKRKYPWEGDFAAWRANTNESGLHQTTPVSMYPGGATPEGVYDMAGNVWEWMQDDYASGKALRGGAYWNDATGVGSAARSDDLPRSRNDDGGLRVVVVPVSRLGPVLVPGS